MNREDYLASAVTYFRPLFDSIGHSLPARIRVACGWPSKSGTARKKPRIGECWSSDQSEDQTFEIFISPTLRDVRLVLETLVHELVHAAVGLECKHRGAFIKCAKAVGLSGKMTETVAGESLLEKIVEAEGKLGNYPHAELKISDGPKTQTTRMKKIQCDTCGCVIRMTRKWLEEAGLPTCGCGGLMEQEIDDGDSSLGD